MEDDKNISSIFKIYKFLFKKYERNSKVVIHGYCYPVEFKEFKNFFLKGADCWGWATWRRAWKKYDNNANNLIKIIKSKNSQREFDFNFSYPY